MASDDGLALIIIDEDDVSQELNERNQNGDIIIEDVNQEYLEPFIGMEFLSLEEALEYYTKYAKQEGFGIRKSCQTKSRKSNEIIGQVFVCAKQGHRDKKYLKKDDGVQKPQDETRVGCKAQIYVSKKADCKWLVSRFVKDHTHELLTPKSSQFLRVHKKRTRVHRNLIDVLDDSGIRPGKIMSVLANESGGIDNVGLTERDIQNYLSGRRQKQIEKGDAQFMLTYFKECQSKNPGFIYAIQMDSEGQLANCFWADARSRIAYKYFGDVVTFDPTYLTNRYKMPFVPFTGVNNHHQSILFGCALLWDETEETFIWLLNTWLEAMFGHHPKTIITDQDTAITNAVAKVFPQTKHNFCMWHIEKKFPENLSHIYHQFDDFKDQFSKCIHYTLAPDEFESEWMKIIEKYGLEENSWLKKLYQIREKWIPAYVRFNFCAGMSTTQRSESMNKYFKGYVNSSTSMSKFVVQYEKALDARYNKEREKNFKTINSKPILKTFYPMEKEAAEVYTRKIFRKFQEELIHSQKYIAEKFDVNEQVYSYRVHEFDKEKPVYIVTFVGSSTTTTCSCHMFDFVGIMCRHELVVLIKKGVHSLPKHRILNRWTGDAKKGEVDSVCDEPSDNTLKSSTMLFNSIMLHSLELSEKASRSQKHHDVAVECLQRLFKKLDALKIEVEKTPNSDILTSTNSLENVASSHITILDPPHVTTKGRPRSLRIKGALEQKSHSKTCSKCKQKGHTKTTCKNPSRPKTKSNLNVTTTSSTIQIDEDSNVTKRSGSMSEDLNPINFTDLLTSMEKSPIRTEKEI